MIKDGVLSFDDPIYNERNGKKALWIDRNLLEKIKFLSRSKGKNFQNVSEYILALGVNTAENTSKPSPIVFDIDSL